MVDTATNEFDHWFAPWPLRFYVVHHGRMEFIAQPDQASYDVTQVPTHLVVGPHRDRRFTVESRATLCAHRKVRGVAKPQQRWALMAP